MNPVQDRPSGGSKNYASADFWDKRYQSATFTFDWYVEYPELSFCFETLYNFPKSSRVLMIGCGNSHLSEQMFDAGYTDITNVDISPTVIHQMTLQMQAKGKSMKWLVMDALKMNFPDNSFDLVVDKGTLDALICSEDLLPSQSLMREMGRVAGKGSVVVITHSAPGGRKKVFEGGLDFAAWDYYFSKIYLSNSNMLINLIKANKARQDGETDKHVLTLSWLEYSLIQMKKKAKPQRTQILWGQFGTVVEEQVTANSQAKQDKDKQPLWAQGANQISQPGVLEHSPDPRQQNQEATQPLTQPPKVLNPKQPYCFVYVLSPKPYLDLLETIHVSDLNTAIDKSLIQGLSLQNEGLIVNPKQRKYIHIKSPQLNPALAAICYLQRLGYSLPKIYLDDSSSSNSPPLNKADQLISLQYQLSGDQHTSSVLMSMRSEMDFQITVPSTDLDGLTVEQFRIVEQLQKCVRQLAEVQPIDPRVYQDLAQVAERGKGSINQLIRNLWTPQVTLTGFTSQNHNTTLRGKLYLPPKSSQNAYIKVLQKFEGFTVVNWVRGHCNQCSSQTLSTLSTLSRSFGETQMQRLWQPSVQAQFRNIGSGVQGVFIWGSGIATYAIIGIIKPFCVRAESPHQP